jgi:hypothetical protein
MNKEESIAFLNSIAGLKGFRSRTAAEKDQAFKDIIGIHRELSLLLPQKFANAFARYYLFECDLQGAEISQDLTSYLAYNGGKYGHERARLFEGFMTADDIIDNRKNPADGEEVLFDWGLLKIGRTPWGDSAFYLGVGTHNAEQIYWVNNSFLMDDFDPAAAREEAQEGFMLLADDVYEFLEGLHAHYPEEEGVKPIDF